MVLSISSFHPESIFFVGSKNLIDSFGNLEKQLRVNPPFFLHFQVTFRVNLKKKVFLYSATWYTMKLKLRNVNSSLKFMQPFAHERCWLAVALYSVWFPAACQVDVGAVLTVGIHCCNNYKQQFHKNYF